MIVFPGAVIGGYSAKAVSADGDDYLQRSSAIAGISDVTTGLLSFWVKSTFSDALRVMDDDSSHFVVNVALDNILSIVANRSNGDLCLSMRTTSGLSTSGWSHVLAAWDLSADALCKIYINGSDDTSISIRDNQAIDYTTTGWTIGALNGAEDLLNLVGDMAELYFTTEWLDITDSSVRQTFAKNGRPVNLGSDGSRPTGTAPLIYLKGPASTWGTNAGSGGDFTVHGTFTDASTKPSY